MFHRLVFLWKHDQWKTFHWRGIRNKHWRVNSQSMIYSVFSGNGISIFQMEIQKDVLNNRPSMAMVVLLYQIFRPSNFEHFFSDRKGFPFALEKILKSTVIVPNLFMENILIVNISCSGSPCKIFIHSNWHGRESITHHPEGLVGKICRVFL